MEVNKCDSLFVHIFLKNINKPLIAPRGAIKISTKTQVTEPLFASVITAFNQHTDGKTMNKKIINISDPVIFDKKAKVISAKLTH